MPDQNQTDDPTTQAAQALGEALAAINAAADALGVEPATPTPPQTMNDAMRGQAAPDPGQVARAWKAA